MADGQAGERSANEPEEDRAQARERERRSGEPPDDAEPRPGSEPPRDESTRRRRIPGAAGAPVGAAAAVAGRQFTQAGGEAVLHHQATTGAGQAAGALGHQATEAAGALGHQATEAAGALGHQAAGAPVGSPAGGPSAPPSQVQPAQVAAGAAVAAAVVAIIVGLLAMGDDPPPESAAPTTTEAPFAPPSGGPGELTTGASESLSGNLLQDVDLGSVVGPLVVAAIAGSPDEVGQPVLLPSGATVTVQADGSFDYDPGEAFAALGGGETSSDTFAFTVADQAGWSDEWTATVTVTGVNDPPVIETVPDPELVESTTAAIELSASDPEGDGLSFALDDGAPPFATIVTGEGGAATLSLAPVVGDAGTHSLTVTVTDDGSPAQSTSMSLTVTVPPVPAPPPRVTPAPAPPLQRVADGLLVLYEFDGGSGATAADTAGTDSPYGLIISDPGAVTWTDGSLRIDRPTTLIGEQPADRVSAAIAGSNGLTIEAWVTPANDTQDGPARVVSLSSGVGERNATLAQGGSPGEGGDRWTARLRSTATDPNGKLPLQTPAGTVTPDRLTHLALVRSPSGDVVLYVDGAPAATAASGGDLSNWDDGYRLMLANETSGDRPWLGTYHLVAVYGRALSVDEVDQNFRVGP